MNEAETSPISRATIVEEAIANVAGISDLEMKKIAFQAELTRLADLRKRWERRVGWAASIAGVLSVMIGIMLSIASFALARHREDETRRQALLQPSLELRRNRYLDILSTLGKIAADDQDDKTLVEAKRRFWELYWADLSLVEDDEVKKAMQELGGMLKSGASLSTFQQSTYKFASLIRQRIVKLEEKAQ